MFLVMFSMLIALTKIDTTYIVGIQGRYFIPVLSLVFFANIRDKKLQIDSERVLLTVFIIVLSVQCTDIMSNHILTFLFI